MPEHRIRLRAGWDWHASGTVAVQRIDLPIDWPADVNRSIRLVRRFGRPRYDPAIEAIRLEMLDVPGMISATLNGRLVEPIILDDLLLPRNELVLNVHLAGGPISAWGSIALVIATR